MTSNAYTLLNNTSNMLPATKSDRETSSPTDAAESAPPPPPDLVNCTFMTSTPVNQKLPHYHRMRDIAVPLRGKKRKRLFTAADDHQLSITRTKRNETIHPQLVENHLLLAGDTLYALYPLPETFCSDHCKIKPMRRPIINCMLHLCGNDHLRRMKKLSSGRWAVSNLKLVEICGFCHAVPANIKAHITNLHQAELFTPDKRTDLCVVENFNVDVDVPILQGISNQ